MQHHVVKAGLDIASIGLAIGVLTDYIPVILALPSFIWGIINLIEWGMSKYEKRKK